VLIVGVPFVIDPVRKLLDVPTYLGKYPAHCLKLFIFGIPSSKKWKKFLVITCIDTASVDAYREDIIF
jgi:hypothetical protein